MKRAALLCICLLVLAAALPSMARETVVGMSKVVYDDINEIQVLMDQEAYTEALEALHEARQRRKLTSYEIAHIMNLTGYTYYQLNRMDRALAAYQEALAQPELPDSQIRALLTTLSQLLLVTEDYQGAEKYALQLLQTPGKAPPQTISYIILAQAYIGQEHYQQAIEPLRTALAREKAAGKVPRENWMALLSAVYFNLEDFASMRTVLYEMVEAYPKERYLMNLAALHGQLGEIDKQLALVEALMDEKRLQRGNHLLSLANLFMALELPYKAARLLSAEMTSGRIETNSRNLEMQSQAWYMAGEPRKSIPPLEAAAAMATDGKLYMRVARLYMDIYDWAGAEAAANAAIAKGKLDDPGNAYLLQGMALARNERLQRAKKSFEQASKYKKTEKWAQQWLKFVNNEQRRLAALQI